MGVFCFGELGVRILWYLDWVVIIIELVIYIYIGFNLCFIIFFIELNMWYKLLVIWNINDGYEVMMVIISCIF